MPISVPRGEKITEVMLEGLNQGLKSHIAEMFQVLCTSSTSDQIEAISKFSRGVDIVRRAYMDAKIVIEEEGPQ